MRQALGFGWNGMVARGIGWKMSKKKTTGKKWHDSERELGSRKTEDALSSARCAS